MTVLVPFGLLAAAWLALWLASRRPRVRVTLLPATLHDCGCLCAQGVLLAACAEHDPAEPPVEQWAAELGEDR